jgi:hypothetical protein
MKIIGMEDFSHLEGDEKIKAENDFLKMKMMLEQGAQFGGTGNGSMPVKMENDFLNYIMAFEAHAANPKTIKVFDKIGRPQHFKPVNEIPNDAMEQALVELRTYLGAYGISLSVCSPNISTWELYRFVIEELFDYDMNDFDYPGVQTSFN